MVRLLVIFAPAFSLLAAIGIIGILKPFYTLLRETPHIAIKAKRGLARVSKEYSGIAVFLIFILVVTNFAFSPQSGGVPRVYGSAYTPITISAASLPIAPSEQLPQWLDMLGWTQSNLNSTTVVCAWWDYGYWLSILGNVTTLADNATVNNTKIENIGFIFMANETQALKMLEKYNAKYILVFTVLQITTNEQGYYTAKFAGLGDEGKWMWMARISGQAKIRLTNEGFMDDSSNVSSWTDETTFYNQSSGAWYDYAKESTIYKLMSWAKQRWCDVSGMSYVTPDEAGIQPTYFNETYFAGEDVSISDVASIYGGLVPMVCLYEINWDAYYNATSPVT
jgi:asparagine N-glycosylation enzyme membrane subunit Stt3